eukprot:1621502-Pyramimonas_sp.AAC.1
MQDPPPQAKPHPLFQVHTAPRQRQKPCGEDSGGRKGGAEGAGAAAAAVPAGAGDVRAKGGQAEDGGAQANRE